jgi:hypothetical protein
MDFMLQLYVDREQPRLTAKRSQGYFCEFLWCLIMPQGQGDAEAKEVFPQSPIQDHSVYQSSKSDGSRVRENYRDENRGQVQPFL